MSDESDFLAELDSEIKATLDQQGGTWPAFIVRALWKHPSGRVRADVYQSIRIDAEKRGRKIPRTFDQTIQQSFEKFNSGSDVWDGNPQHDIFSFPQGKGAGFWGLNLDRAKEWMRANGRTNDLV